MTVVRKEYLERLRSRSFLIGTVLGPVIMAALILGPALLELAGVEPFYTSDNPPPGWPLRPARPERCA